jgi:UDP-N-acetylmuramate dehydrogenase
MAAQRTALFDRIASGLDAELKADFPLAPWTSVRVGGPAEVFAKPRSPAALVELLRRAKGEGAPVAVIGGGANTLVGDGGVAGVTLKLPPELVAEEVALDGHVTLPAGAAIARLIQLMKSNGRVGAEFLAGIPGTVGGAVSMNAGTKMGECMTVVEAVELATPDGIGWCTRAELAVQYRQTALPPGSVVTRVRFALPEGDLAQSQAKMDADLGYRKRTQPLSQPNFGSVFQNPPGDHAGRLIEQAGLKGHLIGRAQISSLHANWIVNLGGAAARDVVSLMELAQTRVRDAFGVQLQPEVRRIGRFT